MMKWVAFYRADDIVTQDWNMDEKDQDSLNEMSEVEENEELSSDLQNAG